MSNELERIINILASIDSKLSLVVAQEHPCSPSPATDEGQEEVARELKRTQSMLIHSEKMASLGSMAAGVAHELNNPLAWILSNFQIVNEKYLRNFKLFSEEVETLCRGDEGNIVQLKTRLLQVKKQLKIDFMVEDIGEMVEESMEGAQKMRKIVEGLRSFSRVDGEELLESSMEDILESALSIGFNQIKYVATIHKEYQPIPPCRVIPSQLSQVFLNLIINAAQAMKDKSVAKGTTPMKNLYLRLRASDTHAIVEVQDEGQGIPAENLSRIFDPFFTTKEVGEGTGLGLNIAYNIVQAHEGEISVESEMGKGTTFVVSIPFERSTKEA